jgi:DNA-binding response OmpR family regulator
MAGDREKVLAGYDDFDTKPVEFDRLLANIEQALVKKTGEPGPETERVT